MAKTTIIVDGTTLLDRDIGEWTTSVPELADFVKPGIKPEPHMLAMLPLLTSALMRNEPFAVEITTRPGGFTLDVDTP